MCGRLTFHSGALRLQYLDGIAQPPTYPGEIRRKWEEQWNTSPTQTVAVVVHDEPRIRPMRWWLTPAWADSPSPQYSMFNARAETIATKPAFRGPFKHRRCVVPVDGYFEWLTADGKKQPYLIEPVDQPMLLAGVWDVWEKEGHLESFAIITTDSSPELQWLHTRMPVLLAPDAVQMWLDPKVETKALMPLLTPMLPIHLQAWAVTPKMGNSRYQEPDCVTPISDVRRLG